MIPIVIITIAYVLGILGGLYKICIVPFCLVLCICFFKTKERKIIIFSMILFLFGIIYAGIKINAYDNKYLPDEIEEAYTVISEPIEKDNSNSYIVKNKNKDKFILYLDKDKIIRYGSKILVNGNLKLPEVSRNRRRL